MPFLTRRNFGKKRKASRHPTRKSTAAKKKQMSKKKMAIILASTLAAAVAIGMNRKQLMALVQKALGKKTKQRASPGLLSS